MENGLESNGLVNTSGEDINKREHSSNQGPLTSALYRHIKQYYNSNNKDNNNHENEKVSPTDNR